MIFGNLDRIVFTGDSVTDMSRVRPVGEAIIAKAFLEQCGFDYFHSI